MRFNSAARFGVRVRFGCSVRFGAAVATGSWATFGVRLRVGAAYAAPSRTTAAFACATLHVQKRGKEQSAGNAAALLPPPLLRALGASPACSASPRTRTGTPAESAA